MPIAGQREKVDGDLDGQTRDAGNDEGLGKMQFSGQDGYINKILGGEG